MKGVGLKTKQAFVTSSGMVGSVDNKGSNVIINFKYVDAPDEEKYSRSAWVSLWMRKKCSSASSCKRFRRSASLR